MFFGSRSHCLHCGQALAGRGSALSKCHACESAVYCSDDCSAANAPQHASFCSYLRQLRCVFDIDFERWTQWVPFR